jgi:hypothetical protein
MNRPESCCFVYVATGEGYVREAVHSGATLRRHHPEIPIYLLTDCPPKEAGPFTEVLRPRGLVEHSPIDKLLAYEAPHERVVFLDSDTHVLGDLTSMFEVLDTFDIALLQEVSRGWDYQLPGVPLAFPEFNTGVVAFRKSDEMKSFFEEWRVNFARFHETLLKRGTPFTDQPSLRYTLFHSKLRVATLPSEYHFFGDYPNYIMWKALLLHGRGNYERVARQVNEQLGYRAYLPQIGVVTSYQGKKKLLSDWLRLTRRMLRLLVCGSENVNSKRPSMWWLERDKKPPEARG